MIITLRPCARPRVTVDTHPRDPNGFVVRCHVPGCDTWSYPSDLQFIAILSDAQAKATWHRGEHRILVPTTSIRRDEVTSEWDVHCSPCGGHRRTFATKREAQAWLDQHLAEEHGAVVSR